MAKRMIIMLISVGIILGGIFGWYFFKQHMISKMMSNFKAPPTTISATKAVTETWHPYIPAVGNLSAVNGVIVTPQTSGMITKVLFNSGSYVVAGAPLVQLDTRTEEADLLNYNAQYKLAKLNYERDSKLLVKGAISKSTLDSDQANLQEALANVEATKVQIDQKNIVAPFDGQLGISQVNIGQYIQTGTEIVGLQSLDPLYIFYTLPEQKISQVKVGQEVEVTADSYPDTVYKGKITALDSQINSDTASIAIQATIPNKEGLLLPGMFAIVHTMLPSATDVVVVPETAITYNLYGNSVYIVEDSTDKEGNKIQTAKLQYVTVGERQGNKVAIAKGVNAGDMVVTSGQIKLDSGSLVTINNSVQP